MKTGGAAEVVFLSFFAADRMLSKPDNLWSEHAATLIFDGPRILRAEIAGRLG